MPIYSTDKSDHILIFLFTREQVGTIVGTLFGGWLGDFAARWSEGHGRPWVAVVSVGGGVPMTYCILRLLPQAEVRSIHLLNAPLHRCNSTSHPARTIPSEEQQNMRIKEYEC